MNHVILYALEFEIENISLMKRTLVDHDIIDANIAEYDSLSDKNNMALFNVYKILKSMAEAMEEK